MDPARFRRRRGIGYRFTASCVRSSMDRAPDFGSDGWGFESLRAHAQGLLPGRVHLRHRPGLCTFSERLIAPTTSHSPLGVERDSQAFEVCP